MGRSAKAAKQQKGKISTSRKANGIDLDGLSENMSQATVSDTCSETATNVSSVPSLVPSKVSMADITNSTAFGSTEDEMQSHIARTCLCSIAIVLIHAGTGVLSSIPNSRDTKIEQFSLQFYGQKLIENTTIELTFGRRYGLLGSNGSGKSTFLKSLAAREVPIPEHIDIFLLNEEFAKTEMTGVEAVVEEARKEIKRLEGLLDHIVETEGGDSPLLEDIYERIDAMDPSTFEARASSILHGLGFRKEMMEKATKDMSGGWRMRVSLAKALFVQPTLLLLGLFSPGRAE